MYSLMYEILTSGGTMARLICLFHGTGVAERQHVLIMHMCLLKGQP